MPGVLGTQNAEGGRWAAAIAFAEGMSGGPVYGSKGTVVGLVKGGLHVDAVKWVTPIQHAITLLQMASYSETCYKKSNLGHMRDEIEYFVAQVHLKGKSVYADQIDFFDQGLISRDEAMIRIKEYEKKWPIQNYKMISGSLNVLELADNRYQATFKYSFSVANAETHISGIGDSLIVIRKNDDGFVLETVKEQVQSRR